MAHPADAREPLEPTLLAELTTAIVVAYVTNNAVALAELARSIGLRRRKPAPQRRRRKNAG